MHLQPLYIAELLREINEIHTKFGNTNGGGGGGGGGLRRDRIL